MSCLASMVGEPDRSEPLHELPLLNFPIPTYGRLSVLMMQSEEPGQLALWSQY
jgi:hypothetical protein